MCSCSAAAPAKIVPSRHRPSSSSSSSPLPIVPKMQVAIDLKSVSSLYPRHHRARRRFPPRTLPLRCLSTDSTPSGPETSRGSRRQFILLPSLGVGASVILSAAARAEDDKAALEVKEGKKAKDETQQEVESRIYDATSIGEPLAVGKDKSKVWEKILEARIVYLGEAETVPDRDDRVLELEIVRNLRNKCFEQKRPISLALEVFPCNLQEQLNLFMSKKIDGESLKSFTFHWPPQLWQEYEPLLNYCRDNGVRLVACGTPLEILRTVQAKGIRGLTGAQRKLYAPPIGSDFGLGISSHYGRLNMDSVSPNRSVPFAPASYLSTQSRVVDDYVMSQAIFQAMKDGGAVGMLVVVTGASHVIYGARGIGIPARISKKLQKKNQVVILLDPERQQIRSEGEVPVADFLWYSSAKTCRRNCFDRAEISRVMNATGRRRETLPKDLQRGLDLGLVSPENLQNLFDLEGYPLIAELIHRFQGFRERLLADPKFLNRLAIEEAISISTTLLAQYERRKERFFEEIDYVLTDTIRGSVVDFFTVWLPAPTVSFLSSADTAKVPESLEVLKGLLGSGSIPDNAFQKVTAGKEWDLKQRFASVVIGGLKLAGVGFISSIGAGSASSVLQAVRRVLTPSLPANKIKSRTPLLKSSVVYAGFLGISANLRYQVIAGIVEHRISDYLLVYDQPLLVNGLSFVVRTINSYLGTQQWVDLARYTGLQPRKTLPAPEKQPNDSDSTATCISSQNSLEEISNKSGDASN